MVEPERVDAEHPAHDDAAEARKNARPALIILMGTSGCGKSTCGKQLSVRLGAPFIDGDDLHPKSNVEKMTKGTPLTDEDREPWLEIIRATAARVTTQQALDHEGSVAEGHRPMCIIACSALKRSYRETLRGKDKKDEHSDLQTYFIYLHAPYEMLRDRMSMRLNHFMTVAMLDSQLKTLERPQPDEAEDCETVELGDENDIPKNPAVVADDAEAAIHKLLNIAPHTPVVEPSRPPPKSQSILPHISVITSASASIGVLIESLSTLLEPSQSLKSDLAPEIQQRLHSDKPPPIKSYADLLDFSQMIINDWPNAKKADFLSSHPRIGETSGLSSLSSKEQGGKEATSPETLERLSKLNALYEKRYPQLRYVTFVKGRSRAEIADELAEHLGDVLHLEDKGKVPEIKAGSAEWTQELDRGIRDVFAIAKARLAAMGLK